MFTTTLEEHLKAEFDAMQAEYPDTTIDDFNDVKEWRTSEYWANVDSAIYTGQTISTNIADALTAKMGASYVVHRQQQYPQSFPAGYLCPEIRNSDSNKLYNRHNAPHIQEN